MVEATGEPGRTTPPSVDAAGARPTAFLPWAQLLVITVYWFGIQAIWGAYEVFGQKQVQLIVGDETKGATIGIIETIGSLIALIVQPTAGTLSDYTATRWGKRKAYILVGSVFDLIFLGGLALLALPEPEVGTWDGQALGTTATFVLYVACYWLLQISSNAAQGPFQGYVPDLVPEPQVGTASGLMGVMRQVGLIFGAIVMAIGSALNEWGLALLLVGVIELALAVLTFVYVHEGPTAQPRAGRSWLSIALGAWGLDVLREHSFLLMSAVRFCFLAGTGIFANIALYYLEDSMGVTDPTARGVWQVAALGVLLGGGVVGAPVGAAISNRTGRKPVIWGGTGVAAVGIVILAVAPSTWLALPGMVVLGLGLGSYLSVDWALMTEVIPLAASGRYMGLANIANSMAGPIGLLFAGLTLDYFTGVDASALGPRAGIALGLIFLAGAAVALVGVHPRRDPRHIAAA